MLTDDTHRDVRWACSRQWRISWWVELRNPWASRCDGCCSSCPCTMHKTYIYTGCFKSHPPPRPPTITFELLYIFNMLWNMVLKNCTFFLKWSRVWLRPKTKARGENRLFHMKLPTGWLVITHFGRKQIILKKNVHDIVLPRVAWIMHVFSTVYGKSF